MLKTVWRGKDKLFAIVKPIKRPVDLMLYQVEKISLHEQCSPPMPPVFIVGPSRSGTTLLYQLLVNNCVCAYISNLEGLFPYSTTTFARIRRRLQPRSPVPDYESTYGVSRGLAGPSSGAQVWTRWFTQDGRPALEVGSEHLRRNMQRTVSTYSSIFGGPFINKWSVNSARIASLAESFPEALFLVVNRDPLEIAQSMLAARRNLWNDPYKPITSWPGGFPEYRDRPYIHSVCLHLQNILRSLDEGRQRIPGERVLDVHYRALCENPGATLEEIRNFYRQATGKDLVLTHTPESRFEYRRRRTVDQDDYDSLRDFLSAIGLHPAETDANAETSPGAGSQDGAGDNRA